jgi:glycyl-tRNA synthetase
MELIEKIVSLSKRRGIIFQSSEIYGGISAFWDYGPLGVEMKNNIKAEWWKNIVYLREDVVGIDTTIIIHPLAWKASGHIDSFFDPLTDCKNCKKRFRGDQISSNSCPECGGELTEIRNFNLMFETYLGPVKEEAAKVYLRPETAQGIFLEFENILNTSRKKIPFGIAQIGKSFRNEITTGNFIFRCREFEQMEIEFFVEPETADYWLNYWVEERLNWYINLGIKKDNLRLREHTKEELAHYARKCYDIEYKFPFGWQELEGIADRGDFDLSSHSKYSGKDLSYYDDVKKIRYIPYVIESSAGVDRTLLAILIDAYDEDIIDNEERVILRLHPKIAPIKVAIFPLVRKGGLPEVAKKIEKELRKFFTTFYDEVGSIGRRYRRQDEIGTPFAITVDFQTLEDNTVTLRDRDTTAQERYKIEELKNIITEKII